QRSTTGLTLALAELDWPFNPLEGFMSLRTALLAGAAIFFIACASTFADEAPAPAAGAQGTEWLSFRASQVTILQSGNGSSYSGGVSWNPLFPLSDSL